MAVVPSFIPSDISNSINGAINNFFGADSIDVIRSIDYDVKYLWAIKIVTGKPPVPFDTFFPAQDVAVPMAIVESETIEFAQSSIQVPMKSTGKELSITFYDDEKRTLLYWLTDWMNIDILNGGNYMSGIEDRHTIHTSTKRTATLDGSLETGVIPVRQIQLTLLSKYKKVDKTIVYDVFPVGELPWVGDQSSEAQTYTVRFAIVKEASVDNEIISKKDKYTSIAKDILGKFI